MSALQNSVLQPSIVQLSNTSPGMSFRKHIAVWVDAMTRSQLCSVSKGKQLHIHRGIKTPRCRSKLQMHDLLSNSVFFLWLKKGNYNEKTWRW